MGETNMKTYVSSFRTITIARILFILTILICFSQKENRCQSEVQSELKVWAIPEVDEGAEFYFSPDSKSLIGNAKLNCDTTYHVYTFDIDGKNILRINNKGEDACSYYFPDGKHLIFTSTRDNTDMPPGNYSNPFEYPQGAELYSCNSDGSDLKRLTDNKYYDAEASLSPDGKWILFTRQINGKLDLWKMHTDGSEQQQVTFTPYWQEGGSFFINNETIICRGWELDKQVPRGMPMSIFTMKSDGSGRRRVTDDPGTNWAPFPAPDGDHFVFVKVIPPRNYEIYLMSLSTGEQSRLTFNEAFDGFPAISPDGRLLTFDSNRDIENGERKLKPYLMDISSLDLGSKKEEGTGK
jgi:Tol biopolymer transport system component